MRDRETDSWWSIMSSSAIGGELQGSELREIPVSDKTTWGEWRERHPDTLVLSVDGREHVEDNPYENYFEGEETFRSIEIDDDRLPAKASVYAFWHAGTPHVIANEAIEGGKLVRLDEDWIAVFQRDVGASVFASSRAHRVPAGRITISDDPQRVIERIESGEISQAQPLEGFDTYWYNWVIVNPETELLKP